MNTDTVARERRRDWAVMRATIARQVARRELTCAEKGHPVYPVGPYLICRDLGCKTLVVTK